MIDGIGNLGSMIPPDEIKKFLGGINFPINKDQLWQKVQEKGAPGQVVDMIKNSTQQRFSSPQDVMNIFGGKK